MMLHFNRLQIWIELDATNNLILKLIIKLIIFNISREKSPNEGR